MFVFVFCIKTCLNKCVSDQFLTSLYPDIQCGNVFFGEPYIVLLVGLGFVSMLSAALHSQLRNWEWPKNSPAGCPVPSSCHSGSTLWDLPKLWDHQCPKTLVFFNVFYKLADIPKWERS